MGFSLGGPIVKDKVHFFSSLEYIGVRCTDTEISWVPTPEFIAASGAADPGVLRGLRRHAGHVRHGPHPQRRLGDRRHRGRRLQQPAGRTCRSSPGSRRACRPTPAAATRRSNYQFVDAPRLQPEQRDAGLRPLRLPGPDDGAGHELRRARTTGSTRATSNNNHNLLGSLTHVCSPSFTSQTKVVVEQARSNDQPLNGDPQPTLYMNPTTAVRLQGYRIAFPGYLPCNPGSAIPFGGPQKQLAVLPGLQLGQGQARHPLRRLLHAHRGRPHLRRVRERGRGAQHHADRACPRSTTSSWARSSASRARSTRTASRAAPTRRRSGSRAS